MLPHDKSSTSIRNLDLSICFKNLYPRPLPKDDPLQRQPIIELAKKELDWEPRVSLEEGLEKTISWFKNSLV